MWILWKDTLTDIKISVSYYENILLLYNNSYNWKNRNGVCPLRVSVCVFVVYWTDVWRIESFLMCSMSCVSDKAAPSLKGGVACNRVSPFLFIDAYATISSCNSLYWFQSLKNPGMPRSRFSDRSIDECTSWDLMFRIASEIAGAAPFATASCIWRA